MGKTIKNIHEVPATCDERFAPIHNDVFVSWRKLGIVRSGISHLRPGYRMGRQMPQQQMMILTTGGCGYAHGATQDHEWKLEPGSLFMSGPRMPVAFGCHEQHEQQKQHWDIYWWYVEGHSENTLSYYHQDCESTKILSASMEALFAETGDIERNREWSLEAEQADINTRSILLSDVIAHYLAEFIRTPVNQVLNTQKQQLMVLWREVDRNLHKDWSIGDFAAFLQVSTATLQRWMKKYYHTSCHQMLIERRMQRACQLLLHTDYSLESIAELLAYCDGFTFSNAFKLKYGVSPSHYRKQQE
ncbi:MAG: AraC family transcriptional regulator [Planctomycetes bacterium]|nr:AraC family transcriptional regulator [Planctomycetota bacterium]